jgi:transglutaminase-like putative cysteine protease
VSGWAANPTQRLLDVAVLGRPPRPTAPAPPTASGGAEDEEAEPAEGDAAGSTVDAHDTRLRLAVLTDWDGVTWHVGADYRTAGRVLPAPAAPPGFVAAGADAGEPRTVVQRITVAELEGRLLPAVSAARRVDGVRVAYDEVSGTLIRPEGLAPGVGYTVTSVNPPVDVNLLPAADVPAGPGVARYLTVGDTVPPDLAKLAEQVASGEGSPYLRALALEAFLADHYRYVGDAPSGHAYPNLRFFLFGPVNGGGQRGTSEQFAAAFAALARLLGMPSRVVVGFSVPAGGGPVTGADGVAWPEVLFADVGWVPFNPLPDPGAKPQPLEEEYLPKPLPPTEAPPTVEPSQEPPLSESAGPPSSAAAPAAGVAVGVIAGGVGGALAGLVALLVVAIVVLRSAQRRRRLERGSPPERVLGAWHEVGDALALAGAPPAPHLSTSEIAAHAAAVVEGSPGRLHSRRPRPAAPPLDELATVVNAVGFGPGDAVADESLADEAGRRAIGYADALRARRSWWRRWWWSVSPRPLRRRR